MTNKTNTRLSYLQASDTASFGVVFLGFLNSYYSFFYLGLLFVLLRFLLAEKNDTYTDVAITIIVRSIVLVCTFAFFSGLLLFIKPENSNPMNLWFVIYNLLVKIKAPS